MIKDYLKAHIKEQIERSLYLKSLIPRPIHYAELTGLVDRCSRILDDNIKFLRYLLNELEMRDDEDDIRDLYRSFRVAYRNIETIEYFGIPALRFQSDDVKYLNKLIFTIQNEINTPFVAPSVACFSNRYYWIHGITNVIFMPIGEASSLLHLPDIFHELGHATLFNKDNDIRLEEIKNLHIEIISLITNFYEELLARKEKKTGPQEIIFLIKHIHAQWKKWINEFFSDLFACYSLGPAYVWAHLHLILKKSDDVYKLEKPPIPQSHPSDDSRMKMMEIGLRLNGFDTDADEIIRTWNSMPFVTSSVPILEYQYAYPNPLMEKIGKLTLDGMKKSGFSILTPEELRKLDDSNIRKILNDAWKEFWKNPNYIEWEKNTLDRLKRTI